MRLYDMEMEDEPDVWVWSWTWPGCVNWARLGFDEIVRPARLARFRRIIRRLVDAETTTEESWRERVELEA